MTERLFRYCWKHFEASTKEGYIRATCDDSCQLAKLIPDIKYNGVRVINDKGQEIK